MADYKSLLKESIIQKKIDVLKDDSYFNDNYIINVFTELEQIENLDKKKIEGITKKIEKFLSKQKIDIEGIKAKAKYHAKKLFNGIKDSDSQIIQRDKLIENINDFIRKNFSNYMHLSIGILFLITYVVLATLLFMNPVMTLQSGFDSIIFLAMTYILYKAIKTYKVEVKVDIKSKLGLNNIELHEDQELSNPVDLNPSVMDNIDPKETLANKIDFIHKKLEDLLAGGTQDDPDPLNNKFDIDGLELIKK